MRVEVDPLVEVDGADNAAVKLLEIVAVDASCGEASIDLVCSMRRMSTKESASSSTAGSWEETTVAFPTSSYLNAGAVSSSSSMG